MQDPQDLNNPRPYQFPTPLQQLQYVLHYSRYRPDLGRRETYPETVNRAVDYLAELSRGNVPQSDLDSIRSSMLSLDVMPSMRLLAMAGDAARRDNASIYNCSYLSVSSIDSFVDALSMLMAGCGVGYSVEGKFIRKLPVVRKSGKGTTGLIEHAIEDSARGWAGALALGLHAWFDGGDCTFDYSLLRPKGAVLKTKGGRASGPDVLRELLDFCRTTVLSASGRKLSSLECHDIMCMIGKCVVSGGVRRSAMIALFDEDDQDMLTCKDNIDWESGINTHRASANNSVVWTGRKSRQSIEAYVDLLHEGRNGEPGIVSRHAMRQMERDPIRPRKFNADMGVNPCGEITLNDMQFCNLSIVVARPADTLETLSEKVRLATIIGTIQACAISFPYLRQGETFIRNSRLERLIGVDITGQMDCAAARDPRNQRVFRSIARDTNARYADLLGINHAASVTCVKPSGNSSVLLDCAPGLHARFAPFYIRRIRIDSQSPVSRLLIDQGFSAEQDLAFPANLVFSFPVRAPEGAITQSSRTALEQLEYWKQVKLNYTTHNPSCTVSYWDGELADIADWLYVNQDILGGISFLPKDDIMYPQAPYEEIDEATYLKLIATQPIMDLSRLPEYEVDDETTLATEFACVSGLCEI